MICAVFFGGYMAKPEHVALWQASARKQKPGIEFGVRPWPSGAAKSDGDDGINAFKTTRQFDSLVAALKASPADKIYIVGHSSGCAIANEVDRALKGSKVASKVVLVALDGYRPDADQLARDNTQVWGAVSGVHKSFRYPKPKEKTTLEKNFHDYKARADITTEWALHFSLVNTAVTNKTGILEDGYKDCEANLIWVDEDLKVKKP
jgi:hypothetical protein